MLSKDIFRFFNELAQNNHKEWFDAHRKEYEAVRRNFLEFTTEMIGRISEFDPGVRGLEASKCMFRINRDVRFSKNKDPYKTHIAFSITPGGKKTEHAGYYFQMMQGDCFTGGGLYAPMPNVLRAIRNEVYYRPDEFLRIMNNRDFKKTFGGLTDFEKLKKSPKGFEDASEKIMPYLLHKHFVVSVTFKDSDVTKADFAERLAGTYRLQRPFIQFVNEAIDAIEEEPVL